MRLLFALTLFVSAALLFAVQPMIAKMILPLLGGTPAVWITCMVFFQAMLLAGYLYAHLTTSWLGTRRQAAFHLGVLLLPLAALPFMRLPLELCRGSLTSTSTMLERWLGSVPTEGNPTLWLLGLLLVCIGLPFFAVATSAPLLQKWFASTGHPDAVDPYFLYGASNFGSMLALVGYPALLEPYLRLSTQTIAWTCGYAALLLLTAVCAGCLWRADAAREDPALALKERQQDPQAPAARITPWTRLYWIGLAFVPSSLLLGVTTYMSTDLAAIPLLWIIPLALYLLTFILVFARRTWLPPKLLVWLLPLLIAAQLLFVLKPPVRIWPVLILHLVTFFVASMLCHGELARRRPPARYLTGFYLWMSFGGVLGGLFSAVLAPLVFNTIAEYPLQLALACLLGPAIYSARRSHALVKNAAAELTLSVAAGAVIAFAAVVFLKPASPYETVKGWHVAGFAGLALLAYAAIAYFTRRPLLFGLGVAAVLMVQVPDAGGVTIYRQRGFFGVSRVTADHGNWFHLSGDPMMHLFFHGSTLHGAQSLDPETRDVPLTYFHRQGPIGQVFEALGGSLAGKPIAVIGLGIGTLAAYGQAGQEMDFYEINPEIDALARNTKYFTYLTDAPARWRTILGDGRLSMMRMPDQRYGIIVLDAFSSDLIPVHLLTREAVRDVYLRKLAPGGVVAFHITNRYLRLEPVLADVAADAGLVARIRRDTPDLAIGKSQSLWVIMARSDKDLGPLLHDEAWKALRHQAGCSVWTDDYSNVMQIMMWR